METSFAERAWSVLASVVMLAVMLGLTFAVFKIIDWARETRRIAEDALASRQDDDPPGDDAPRERDAPSG